MSWSEAGSAITIRDSSVPASGPATFTSTCTLQMQDKSTMPYWLRMFGVKSEECVAYATALPTHLLFVNTSYTHSDWTSRYNDASANAWQEYIESNRWDRVTRWKPKVFDVDKAKANQVTQTPIPRRRIDVAGFTWYRLYYNYSGGAVSNGWASARAAGKVKVYYSDPCVLQLPDGSWLMLLVRYVLSSTSVVLSPTHGNSLSDIVAWHATTPDFEGDEVAGPFLIVEGAHCWSEDLVGRLWVGVPGAAVVRGQSGQYELLVYYVVDECYLGFTATIPPSGLEDGLSEADYYSNLDAAGFEKGMALKRIQLDDLTARINAERVIHGVGRALFPYTTETNWTAYQVDPSNAAVEGELLGAPRFWVADGFASSGRLQVRAFDAVFSRESVVFRAPAPLVCSTNDDLSLYFAAVLSGAGDLPRASSIRSVGSGHGIWRGRSLPGYDLAENGDTGSLEVMMPGRDVVVAAPDGLKRRSADQVAQSYTYLSEWGKDLSAITSPTTSPKTLPGPSYVLYLDPDPVQLEDGTFWVATSSPTLMAFTGTEEDGCASADAIFDHSEPATDVDEDDLAFVRRPGPETRILPSPLNR